MCILEGRVYRGDTYLPGIIIYLNVSLPDFVIIQRQLNVNRSYTTESAVDFQQTTTLLSRKLHLCHYHLRRIDYIDYG